MGKIDDSLDICMAIRALLPKVLNVGVGLTEANIQMIGVYRKRKMFGAAINLITEAKQARKSLHIILHSI